MTDFQIKLQNEFSNRKRKNQRYSLRAFARQLKMDPSSVSQILSGKRVASYKVIAKICDRLAIDPAEFTALKGRKGPKADAKNHAFAENTYTEIASDVFAAISDWYHYAILELTNIKTFDDNPKWIASELGISTTEAAVGMQRLIRLGLLEKRRGRWKKTEAHLTNGTQFKTGPAMRSLQKQILEKALLAIDEVEPEEKDITSMTMAIDPQKLPEARLRLKKFRREFCEFLESSPKRSRVYNLGLQLYPISKINKQKELL